MNFIKKITMVFGVSVLFGYCQLFAQSAEELFPKGIQLEEVKGELEKAIEVYQTILTKYPESKSIAAKAQLHVGLCYEKLGKTEAMKAYELVLQNYQNYEDEVEVASLRLSKLKKDQEDEQFVIDLYEKGADLRDGTMLDNSSLSPDGLKILGIDYTMGQNVGIYDRNTKKVEVITKYDWSSENNYWTYYPIWSPDGKEVAYMYGDWKGEEGCGIKISTLIGKTQNLIKNEFVKANFIPGEWSKDGKSI